MGPHADSEPCVVNEETKNLLSTNLSNKQLVVANETISSKSNCVEKLVYMVYHLYRSNYKICPTGSAGLKLPLVNVTYTSVSKFNIWSDSYDIKD